MVEAAAIPTNNDTHDTIIGTLGINRPDEDKQQLSIAKLETLPDPVRPEGNVEPKLSTQQGIVLQFVIVFDNVCRYFATQVSLSRAAVGNNQVIYSS